jgi:hypothetical protein
MGNRFRHLLCIAAATVLLAACERGGDPPPAPAGGPPAPGAAEDDGPVPLQDVVETRPDYIVGISYPESARRHPALARVLRAYAEAARADLMTAVAGLGGGKPGAPYDLSLQFTGLVDRPEIVVVAADGSSYTGGAHGKPLVARFVWLPAQERLLTAEALLASPDGWQVVADAAREQLATGLSQRLDADEVQGAERMQQFELGTRMIAEGTAPEPGNFTHFEPVVDADGRIRALRFVFPPLQVAPYMEGTRTADVPAAVLLPVLAPGLRPLFRGG